MSAICLSTACHAKSSPEEWCYWLFRNNALCPVQAYDVYKGNSRFSKKRPSGLAMQVRMSQSRPPSRDAMCAAEAACCENEAVFFAKTADKHVSMYSFTSICVPDLLQHAAQSYEPG